MRIKPLSPEALACLMHYDWPGNVRELENAIERALVLGSTDSILPDDLPEAILEAGSTAPASTDKYHGTIKEAKKQLVLQALQQANGNYIEAAKTLGMHPNSLLRLIRNLDLKRESGNAGAGRVALLTNLCRVFTVSPSESRVFRAREASPCVPGTRLDFVRDSVEVL